MPEYDGKAFGNRVLKAMDADGLSYRKAADVIGIDLASLHRMIHGGTPGIEHYLLAVKWLTKRDLDKGKGEGA